MSSTLSEKCVIVLTPTEVLKSFFYQMFSLMGNRVVKVNTPIVSLTIDRVHCFKSNSECFSRIPHNGSSWHRQQSHVALWLRLGHNARKVNLCKISTITSVYLTFEYSKKKKLVFRHLLILNSLALWNLMQKFVVDKAHRVSHWGIILTQTTKNFLFYQFLSVFSNCATARIKNLLLVTRVSILRRVHGIIWKVYIGSVNIDTIRGPCAALSF